MQSKAFNEFKNTIKSSFGNTGSDFEQWLCTDDNILQFEPYCATLASLKWRPSGDDVEWHIIDFIIDEGKGIMHVMIKSKKGMYTYKYNAMVDKHGFQPGPMVEKCEYETGKVTKHVVGAHADARYGEFQRALLRVIVTTLGLKGQ